MRNEKYEKPDFSSKVPFLSPNYNKKIWEYMKSVWEDPADYKVMMGNRMFNLNEILMKEWGAHDNKEYEVKNIMSDTAFLFRAREIASRYAYRGRFPRILICDDVVMHGREIMGLLDKFLNIVYVFLAENQIKVSRRKLLEDINCSLHVYVFAASDNDRLLFDNGKYNLVRENILSPSSLHSLSQQISNFLYTNEIIDTNQVISGKLYFHQSRKLFDMMDDDTKETYKYKGFERNVYVKERHPYFFETICFKRLDTRHMCEGYLTSQPIFSVLPLDDFNILCDKVASYMEGYTNDSAVASFLKRKNNEFIKPRAQLISFLYSILSLADFCEEYLHLTDLKMYDVILSGNYDTVISNFSNNNYFRIEVYQFVGRLCQDPSESNLLWKPLDDIFNNLKSELKFEARRMFADLFIRKSAPEEEKQKEMYDVLDEIFWGIGLDYECVAARYLRDHLKFDEESLWYDPISFLWLKNIMKEKFPWHNMGYLFAPTDCGIFQFDIEMERVDNKMVLMTLLKVGKMAKYVGFRKFSVFIPAIALVDENAFENGKYVRDEVGSFIDYIQNYCYENDPRDKKLLRELNEKKLAFLYCFSSGMPSRELNVNHRTESIYLSEKKVQYNDVFSIREEEDRKQYYLMCARRFIENQKKLSRRK